MNTITKHIWTQDRVLAALVVLTFAVIVSIVGFGPNVTLARDATLPEGTVGKNTQIDLCHNNNGASDYSLVQSKAQAIVDETNAGHPPDVNHSADIIPPFDYDFGDGDTGHYDGRNWGQGSAIFLNNCSIPEPQPSTITVMKSTDDESGNTTEFDFTGGLGSFTVLGDNSDFWKSPDLNAGTYTITESSETGWQYGGVDCGQAETTPTENGITVTLGEGEDVTCTFSNTKVVEPPTSTVNICKKDASGAPLAGWDVSIMNDQQESYGGTTAEGTGCVEVSGVPYGGYTLDETLKDGWMNVSGKGDAVTVDEETETFNITNTPVTEDQGTLRVVKIISGVTNATSGSFAFRINGGDPIAFVEGGNNVTLNVGTTSVTEDSAVGFTITYSNDQNQNADCTNLQVADGQTVTCTITNTVEQGTLRVVKVIEGTTTATSGSFAFRINGGDPIAFVEGGNDTTLGVGTYSVTEDGVIGFTTTYSNDQNQNANCTDLQVTDGQTVTCTVTNTVITEPLHYVYGYKWNDVDGDGFWDEGEPALPGWTVGITDGQTTYSTTTDANGMYWFEVPTGIWTVSETQQTGWTQTGTWQSGVQMQGSTCEFTFAPQLLFAAAPLVTAINSECNFGNHQDLACSLTSSAATVNKGQSFDLIWNTVSAAYVEIDNNVGTNLALSGQTSTSITTPTTFTLTAYEHYAQGEGPYGNSVQCQTTVAVRSSGGGGGSVSPQCDAFAASLSGDETTLTWETRHGRNVTITANGEEIFSTDDDAVMGDGTFTYLATGGDTDYELTVTRGSKKDTCETTSTSRRPTPEVQGVQTTRVPTVAGVSTGAGGTSPKPYDGAVIPLITLVAMLASVVVLHTTKANER